MEQRHGRGAGRRRGLAAKQCGAGEDGTAARLENGEVGAGVQD